MSTLKEQYPLLVGEHQSALRQISAPLDRIDKETKQFARHLLTLMHVYRGVGLAAPQLGYNIRMIAVSKRKTDSHHYPITCISECVMINPVILEHSTETNTAVEGCLSLPGLQGNVPRYNNIELVYQDIHHRKHRVSLHGFNARIVQHEIDHLDGILYIDKVVGGLIHTKSHQA